MFTPRYSYDHAYEIEQIKFYRKFIGKTVTPLICRKLKHLELSFELCSKLYFTEYSICQFLSSKLLSFMKINSVFEFLTKQIFRPRYRYDFVQQYKWDMVNRKIFIGKIVTPLICQNQNCLECLVTPVTKLVTNYIRQCLPCLFCSSSSCSCLS